MLHEGSGSTAVNAFVEIVFDNSDNRFSLENSDEVVLRRTIGHKKDEFFLQRKRANKTEIMSLLEGMLAAGNDTLSFLSRVSDKIRTV